MKFTLGLSPCPNDTFIFDALINHKIDTGEFEFEPVLEDVETLNKWALEGRLDITKISYGVLPLLLESYSLLDAGGALGKGVGPLLITRPGISHPVIDHSSIAIPGRHTTAHLLFSLAYPGALHKQFMVFSEIEEAVLQGRVDCGVIIHENRFTYQQKGLVKLLDLGNFWEQETGCPIPLGGIVMRKKWSGLPERPSGQSAESSPEPGSLPERINGLIRQSVEFAFSRYPSLPAYTLRHAQEMDERVMRQHIDLYVNNYSITLGEEGKLAIQTLLDTYAKIHASAPPELSI